MNWNHLKAFIWLRWRLIVNHGRRQVPVGIVIEVIIKVLVFLFLIFAFIGGLLVGALALPKAPASVFMLFWDGLILLYLFFQMAVLMVELQNSDMFSLDKLMHLPVSPAGAFFINYLGSIFDQSLLLFLAVASGAIIGLLAGKGFGMLVLVPLVAGFVFMITALIHQFRRWLASMMTNPRRRQTLVAVVTIIFFMISMIPVYLPHYIKQNKGSLEKDVPAQTVSRKEQPKPEKPGRGQTLKAALSRTSPKFFLLQSRARLANAVLPPGWLPYGAVSAVEGRLSSLFLTMLGMLLIGGWSLLRSYRTTMRLYQGYFTSRTSLDHGIKLFSRQSDSRGPVTRSIALLQKRLPGLSEQASVITLAGFRSWLRTTEMKMMLLTPVFMAVFFGGMLMTMDIDDSHLRATLTTAGMTSFMLFISLIQIVGNIFAHDRGGFRVYVLTSASRREVLLGKNLSILPFALGIALFVALVSEWFHPMRPDHLLAVVPQTLSVFLLFCITGNMLSIYAPMNIKPGSGQPGSGQGLKILMRAAFTLFSPLLILLSLIPLGIEFLMTALDWHAWFPAFLLFSIVQLALTIRLYSVILDRQANWLYNREQRILEVVTTKAE